MYYTNIVVSNGWKIASGDNGSYILAKPAQALFTFKTAYGTYQYDMRTTILNLFNMQHLSEKSFERFKSRIEKGNIKVFITEAGYYFLI